MLRLFRIFLATLYAIPIFSFGIGISLLRPFNPNSLYLISRVLSWKSLQILGLKFEKRGFEKVENVRPAVFMSNHQDNIDVVIGAHCIVKKTVLIGKRSIFWIPFFGPFFWLSGNILINRKNTQSAKASMIAASKRINDEEICVWILPEGTRSRGRGFLPFKKGGFITAIDCQVPIVPVVWSSYVGKIDLNKNTSGKIIATALDPIETKGLTHDDLDALMEKTHQLMAQKLKEVDQEVDQFLNQNES